MKAGEDFIGVNVSFYCHDGEGNLLLHKRSQKTRDEQGIWDCDGGGLGFRERLRDGVLREVEEEYGCKGTIDEQLPAFSSLRSYKGKDLHWLNNSFIVKVNRAEVSNKDPEKIEELGWFRLNEFPSPLHPAITIAMERNKEIFEKYFK